MSALPARRDLAAFTRLEAHLGSMRKARRELDQAIAAAEGDLEEARQELGITTATDRPALTLSRSDARDTLDSTSFRPTQIVYLEAGVRLIQQAYGLAEFDGRSRHVEDAFRGDVLAFITPTRVCELADRQSLSSFYSQWPKANGGRDAYVFDLLRYIFSRREIHLDEQQDHEQSMLSAINQGLQGGDPSAAIHEITAKAINQELIDDTSWYLQLNLSSMLHPHNPRLDLIRACVRVLYREFDQYYEPQYREFLDTHGLRLRPEVPLEAIRDIFGALSEGLALRYLAKGTRPAEENNLFGLAVLAIIDSLIIDPRDSDERSIEERVNRKFQNLREIESNASES